MPPERSEHSFCNRKTCPNLWILWTTETHSNHWVCISTFLTSVYVAFLVQYFAFFCKDNRQSFIFSINIFSSWTKKGLFANIFPKVQFNFRLNPNMHFLHIEFSLYFVNLLLGVLSWYAQYNFAGFFSC